MTKFSLFTLSVVFAMLLSDKALNAFSYDSRVKARLSTTSLERNIIADGYYVNQLEVDNIIISADIFLDDNEYLYDLSSSNDKIKFYSNLYLGYQLGEQDQVFFGYMPSAGSKYFVDKLLHRSTNYFGVKGLKNVSTNESNTNSLYPNKYYVISSSYLQNNSGLTLTYKKSLFDDTLNLVTSYTTDMDHSVRNYKTQAYNGYTSPLDIAAIYYNEYLDVGYGVRGAVRKYTDSSGDKLINDFSIGAMVDFFGISGQISTIVGNNKVSNPTNYSSYLMPMSYHTIEGDLSYSILSFNVGLYFLNSTIKGLDFNYETNLTEFNIKYQLSSYFNIVSSIFYQNTLIAGLSNLDNDAGILFGLTIEY